MKKLTAIVLVMSLAAGLSACAANGTTETAAETVAEIKAAETEAAKTEPAAETEAVTEAAGNKAEGFVGMPNPMVPVEGFPEFKEQLGITVYADRIDPDAKCFIIAGNLADIQWTQENVNGEATKLDLRATKDAELAPAMHGIYDANLPAPTVSVVPLTDDKNLELSFTESSEGTGIYTWKDGQIFWSLTFGKGFSQMTISAVLDRIMDATGIRWHKENLKALVGITEADNCTVPAVFDKTQILEENGVYRVKCDLYEEELFDAVEVSLMQVGDKMTIQGDTVIDITSLEEGDGGIIVNGGVDNGGFLLVGAGGGTYKVREASDAATYRLIETKELPFDKNILLTDKADYNNSFTEKKIEGDANVAKHIRESEYIYPGALGSTTVSIDNGKIIDIKIVYVP